MIRAILENSDFRGIARLYKIQTLAGSREPEPAPQTHPRFSYSARSQHLRPTRDSDSVTPRAVAGGIFSKRRTDPSAGQVAQYQHSRAACCCFSDGQLRVFASGDQVGATARP